MVPSSTYLAKPGCFKRAWVVRGLAIGDLDNDGREDVVVSTNDGVAYILHNETSTANHWLTLDLVGYRSNRDAIGAEVKAVTSRGSQWVTVSPAGRPAVPFGHCGGLLFSQVLTFYTTPIIHLYFDRISNRFQAPSRRCTPVRHSTEWFLDMPPAGGA